MSSGFIPSGQSRRPLRNVKNGQPIGQKRLSYDSSLQARRGGFRPPVFRGILDHIDPLEI